LCRYYEWIDDKNHFEYVQRAWHEGVVTEKRYKEELIRFIMGWKLFERYCEAKNVKLIWGTWEHRDNGHYKRSAPFNNFIELPAREENHGPFRSFIEKTRPSGKLLKYDLNRRDGHHGVLIHEFWASIFLENILK
jgi:hypothetical protein